MSQIKIDSEDIAEIRNALQIILSNAEFGKVNVRRIVVEVRRIDKLLPDVKFEGGK